MVLVIDDDADILETVADVLLGAEYRVATARNGSDAFELLGRMEQLPDLILLDLMMPVMDGWETIEVFQEDTRLAEIPVVVLTAHGHARVPEAEAMLKKPFSLDSLLDVVREHCS